MAYTMINFRTKKALIEALKSGKTIRVYQPSGLFPCPTDGQVFLEGPHYPEAHSWYAQGIVKSGVLVKVR